MRGPSLPLLSSRGAGGGAQTQLLDPLEPACLRDEVEAQLRAGGCGLHDGEQAIVPARSNVGLELGRFLPDLDVERGSGASGLLIHAAAATAPRAPGPDAEPRRLAQRADLAPLRPRLPQVGDPHRSPPPPPHQATRSPARWGPPVPPRFGEAQTREGLSSCSSGGRPIQAV